MTRRIHSEMEIQASPDRVWEALTDFAAYPHWNPFIVQAAGQPDPAPASSSRCAFPAAAR